MKTREPVEFIHWRIPLPTVRKSANKAHAFSNGESLCCQFKGSYFGLVNNTQDRCGICTFLADRFVKINGAEVVS